MKILPLHTNGQPRGVVEQEVHNQSTTSQPSPELHSLEDEVRSEVNRIPVRLNEIFAEADKTDRPTNVIADELARFVDPATCVYFCMESDNIWQEVFGFSPEEKGGLGAMLDRSVNE